MISSPENSILPILPFDDSEEKKSKNVASCSSNSDNHLSHHDDTRNSEKDIDDENNTKRGSLIELDHDSLDYILSYCPNRGAYEIQSLRFTCRIFNNLFNGGNSFNLLKGINDEEESIAETVKETIRSKKLMERIESAYLPRLFFQIFIPIHQREDAGVIETLFEEFIGEMSSVFENRCIHLSNREMEIYLDLDDYELLDNLEGIISGNKSIDDSFDQNRKSNEHKLFYFDKEENGQLNNHLTLRELFTSWMKNPLIDKNMKLSPFRLCKRVILHLQFTSTFESPNFNGTIISRDSSIYCTAFRRYYVFLNPKPREEISFYYGYIYQEYEKTYCFHRTNTSLSEKCRIILYFIFRHKLIPRMDSNLIDLKQLYGKDSIKKFQKLNDLDQRNFFTFRENAIKKYRDLLLLGKTNFSSFKENHFDMNVTAHVIPEFLTLVSLETLNDRQRIMLLEKLFKHVYNSGLDLSDYATELLKQHCNIDKKNQTFCTSTSSENIEIQFEKVTFKREKSIISSHNYVFPKLPNMELAICKEKKINKLNILTASGHVDKCYSKTFCTTRLCGLCNGCLIASCWCGTCCCCYTSSKDSDVYHDSRGMGFPKWLSCFFKYACRYENRLFPMLDCTNIFDQCTSLKKGNSVLQNNYHRMYE